MLNDTGPLQAVHTVLHKVAPAFCSPPALMPMMMGEIPYRAIMQALKWDAGCLAALASGGLAVLALRAQHA